MPCVQRIDALFMFPLQKINFDCIKTEHFHRMLLWFRVFLRGPDMNGLWPGCRALGMFESVGRKTQWKDAGWVNGGVHHKEPLGWQLLSPLPPPHSLPPSSALCQLTGQDRVNRWSAATPTMMYYNTAEAPSNRAKWLCIETSTFMSQNKLSPF